MFVLLGVVRTIVTRSEPTADPPTALWAILAVAGLAGIIGGVAAFRGNKTWARLAYLFVMVLVFGCPVGTIVSVLWLLGISRHMAACEKIRRARIIRSSPVQPGPALDLD
ncbi:hypothetical protein J8F10_33890 [Gemmata sp. G18]|uniref:DUF4064 domain-containing protein n=1 Tax=Gemmata palustris TaxID=2822762 RepID=A0ABS5C2P2_9BACT|nr:hypothetical protein [Gemmata palustris]MBP3960246.1 hypothetical protein [Gemmata palustris]